MNICPICYNNINKRYGIQVDCCNQHFHIKCLNLWYKSSKKNICPFCRNIKIDKCNLSNNFTRGNRCFFQRHKTKLYEHFPLLYSLFFFS